MSESKVYFTGGGGQITYSWDSQWSNAQCRKMGMKKSEVQILAKAWHQKFLVGWLPET